MKLPLKILSFCIFISLFCWTGIVGQDFGKKTELSEWLFKLGDVRYGQSDTIDTHDWQRIQVPHDWSVDQMADSTLSSCTGYLPGGVAWYRKSVNIPADNLKRYLYFEGIYRNSEVYINGHWLGYRPNGYVSFSYDITPYVKSGDNLIAVKVDHSEESDSRWYTGSGIYRKAYLVTANPVHIDQWGVYITTKQQEEDAWVSIQTTLLNETNNPAKLTLKQDLLDQNGNLVSSDQKVLEVNPGASTQQEQEIRLSKVKYWGIENPYLYTLITQIVDAEGNELDRSENAVGIRSTKFDPDTGFSLNGQNLKIKGVCLHHDAGVLGAAVYKEVWKERLLKLKEIGVNAIRMSHNPQAPHLYDLCDELGFLVMDEAFDEWEFPKKKWIKGWNVGKPGFQGYAPFFKEWGKRDLASVVKRNRNHPSIFMWSIGNEVDYPNDPYSHPILDSAGIGQIHARGYQPDQPDAERLGDIAHELAAVVRAHDPSRPVTAALAGAVMSNETDYPAALDVVGYNYTESRYVVDHKKYPDRILYGSETRHDIEAWKAVKDNDFIFGQFLWTGIDYLGEAGPWPSRGFTTGLLNLAHEIKPRGYFRQSLWSEKPMVYVGTYSIQDRTSKRLSVDAPHSWDYEKGELIRVVAYTNCNSAQLYLNGQKTGESKERDPVSGIIYWDLPYEPGVVSIDAFSENGEKVSDKIRTSGRPSKIRTYIIGDLPSKERDVVMVKVEIVDEEGDIVNNADHEITCNIVGKGRLLGLENASSNAALDYNSDRLNCENGRLLAYIQMTDEEGPIKVHFSTKGLPTASQVIQIE